MKPKTLLITGGSGYLGQHLTPKAPERFDVYAAYHTNPGPIKVERRLSLNLTRRADVYRVVTDVKPYAIIHAAAINPGQGNEDEMLQLNAQGSRYVAEAAVAVGARLVHLSTDVIHDGQHAPYDDDAPPHPLNAYGRSKAAAETAVARVDPGAAIVRTSLIYGLQMMDRGTEGFVKRLNAGRPLTLFNDVIRQPVWVNLLAEALLKLVEIDFSGTLNVAGQQPLTREEYGRRLLAWWQIDTGRVRAGRAVDISDTIPLDLRLLTRKAEQLLQMRFSGVDEVLAMSDKSGW